MHGIFEYLRMLSSSSLLIYFLSKLNFKRSLLGVKQKKDQNKFGTSLINCGYVWQGNNHVAALFPGPQGGTFNPMDPDPAISTHAVFP